VTFSATHRRWLLGLLLVAAVVIAYQPAWHAGFIWDDDKYVTKNELLTAADGLKRIWFSLDSPSQYFPLVYTSFRFERAVWGLNPGPYHWINILVHAANVLLLWRLLYALRLPGCWLAAALFALHPVQVESVAWITERKNVFVCLFSLLSSLSWLRFTNPDSLTRSRRREEAELVPRKVWLFYALSLFFFALALFSKTTACTLPFAFLLLEWWKRKPITWRRLVQVVPFVLMGLAMGLITIWWEQNHQGVKGKLAGIGFLDRILIASRAIWFYLGKLIWPENLSFNYPLWKINHSDPAAYIWLLLTAGVIGACIFARRLINRGIIVALLFYAITLAPLLGFFMLATFKYSFVADHYQYVASIGPFALVAVGITKVFASVEKQNNLIKPIVFGLLLVVLGTLTSRQAQTYANLETLWRATIERNPQSFLAHNNLAVELLAKGQAAEAISHYRKAFEVQPDALTGQNLAYALLASGQVDDAIFYYQQALELQPDAPSIAYNLGNAFSARGRLEEAIAAYRKALELQPTGAAIANTLGNALLTKGNLDEAIIYFRKAIELAPTLARAHNNLGNALIRKSQLAEAIAEYGKTIELQPTNTMTLNNLAWVLAAAPDDAVRNGQRAVALAQKAAQLSGGNSPEILATLSVAYAELGKFSDAIATAQRALELPAAKTNPALADSLESKIKLYESHSPFRDPSLTNSHTP